MNKAKGDMYDWVSHTWNPLAGECLHHCSYCFVRHLPVPVRNGKYAGPPCLVEREMKEHHGRDRTIFVCSCNDLFAEGVPHEMIMRVLERCNEFKNQYVFQTKNPQRYLDYETYFPTETIRLLNSGVSTSQL